MSSDFWVGMLCIPVVAVSVAAVAATIVGLIYLSERIDLSVWKIWPKNPDDRLRNRDTLTATVACAKWVRYFWVPGWHVVVCRTTLYRGDEMDLERHRRVARAVAEAMDAKAERATTF